MSERREHRLLSWTLTTTATTADQEIGSYTPSEALETTFVIQTVIIEVYFTTLSTTAALLGKLTIYYPPDTVAVVKDLQASNTSSGALFGVVIPIPEGYYDKYHKRMIKAICTPASVTSTKWIVQLIGYDK